MSEPFAEATITLVPDTRRFATQLQSQLKQIITNIETGPRAPKIRVAPALTKNFVGDLRGQVNRAVTQAQRGIRPVQIRAVLSDVSQAQIARELRSRTQSVGTGTARRAAAQTGPAAVTAAQQQSAAQRLINTAIAQGLPLLGAQTAAQNANTNAMDRSTGAKQRNLLATTKLTPAQRQLASAQTAVLAATLAPAGSREQGTQLATARNAILTANALAIQGGAQQGVNQAVIQALGPLRAQVTGLEGSHAALTRTSAALRAHEAAARRAARSHEQLTRGAQATGLSFLGIRGATLAASRSFLIGAAAVTIFGKAIQSATDFSTQLSVFRATAGATASELERVRDTARALGADISLPGVTAADAAEAMTELAKAGLSVEDALQGARGILQLATAAAIDNAQATELAANAINAFQLSGRDATRVADTFANAANAAQGSIVDIGIAFQQASAAGRQVGLSFEDTSLFLTVLARNGLRGSDAGTSLRTALLRLIKPTKEARAALKDLGVETRDAAGNLRPDVFIQLAEATRDLSPAARDAKLALIGGQDAFRAISILGRQSIEDFLRLRRELREQGTAAELAAARMTGLRGAIEGLSNVLTTAGSRAGAAFTPALTQITQGLTAGTVAMTQSSLAAQTAGGSIEFLNQVLAGLGTTISLIAPALGAFVSVQARIANTIGVPQILAAVAAYKLFPLVLGRATTSLIGLRNAAVSARFALALLRDPGVTGKAAFFNLYAIGAAAAAAAVFYLATRESAHERSIRRVREATEALITTQEKLNQARDEATDAPLQVSGAELGVLEAQQAAARARAKVQDAPAGTFARTKAELELAVALDNVTIQQNALSDAIERSNAASDVARQAEVNLQSARDEQIEMLARMVATEEALANIRARGPRSSRGPDDDQRAQAQAVRESVEQLQERARAAREEGTAEAIAMARRLELLAAFSTAVNKLPTQRAIEISILAPNLQGVLSGLENEFKATSENVRDQLFSALTTIGTAPEVRAAIIDLADRLELDLVSGARDAGRAGADALATTLANDIDTQTPKVLSAVDRLVAAIRGSLGQMAGLDVQADLATIASGATGATLPVLQQQLANAQQRERDARAAIAASLAAGGPGETPSIRRALRQAIADQARIISEIRGINEQLDSDARAAASEAEQRQKDRFDNILKAMGLARDRRQEAIENAQLTAGVADDLRQTRILRRLAARQIANLVERIAAARAQGQNVQVLIDGLRTLKALWRDLGREVRDLQQTRREEIQAQIAERSQLNIEFAQTTGNTAAEIRFRLREIARLKKLQSAYRRGTIEYLRLRNLIAEQQKAIEDLQKQRNEGVERTARREFEFLQTIQGFTGNLIGNLIPGAFAGGLVGGTTAGGIGTAEDFGTASGAGPLTRGFRRDERGRIIGPAGAKTPAQALGATPDASKGFSAGQGNTTNQLLRKILAELHKLNRGSDHPEGKHQRKTGAAAGDYGGGGGSASLGM